MLSLTCIVDKLLYGAFLHPQPFNVIAVIGNYSYIIYFLCSAQEHEQLAGSIAAALVLCITVFAYHFFDESAVGISGVWCFLYTFLTQHTWLGHLAFWTPSILMLIPLYKVNKAFVRLFGFHLWPWPDSFYLIANVAHIAACMVGFIGQRLLMSYA